MQLAFKNSMADEKQAMVTVGNILNLTGRARFGITPARDKHLLGSTARQVYLPYHRPNFVGLQSPQHIAAVAMQSGRDQLRCVFAIHLAFDSQHLGWAHTRDACCLANTLALGQLAPDSLNAVRRDRWATKPDSGCSGAQLAGDDPIANDGAFEFAENAEHLKQDAA